MVECVDFRANFLLLDSHFNVCINLFVARFQSCESFDPVTFLNIICFDQKKKPARTVTIFVSFELE